MNLPGILKKYDFALLALVLCVINIPYFKGIFVPRHDSMVTFEMFYFFYNEMFFHNELAQWVPYYSFGFPSSYFYLYALTPASYLALFSGWAFKISNVMFLFKLSVLVEQLVLLMGTYLLSRLLFTRRSTVFGVCLAAICGLGWSCLQNQIFFDLRIYYLFPLAAYFLVLFFTEKKGEFLWLAGITSVFWMMGNPQYFVALWFFVLFSIFSVFFMNNKNIWKCLMQRSAANIVLFLIFLVLLGSYFYLLRDTITNAVMIWRSAGGSNSLSNFLIHGGPGQADGLIQDFILGAGNPVYVGLLPLVFFLWAIFKVRNTAYFAFLTAMVLLVFLSWGGVLASIIYFFPGMSYYRHIGFLYGLIKILILICAGFGLDHFWSTNFKTKVVFTSGALISLLFPLEIFHILRDYFISFPMEDFRPEYFLYNSNIRILFIRMGLYFLVIFPAGALSFLLPKIKRLDLSKTSFDKCLMLLLFFAFLFDIYSFQNDYYHYVAMRIKDSYKPYLYTLGVNELQYQPWRLREPADSRAKDAYTLVTRPREGVKYEQAYSFIQFDPCFSEFRYDFQSRGFQKLVSTRKKIDNDLLGLIGCYTPKIRLLSSAIYADTDDKALRYMFSIPKLSDHLVLSNEREEGPPPPLGTKAFTKGGGTLAVKRFSANEIVMSADVNAKEGAWVVYADSFHPGWKAFVNEKKVPVYKAYLAFKAVYLPAGKSIVRFVYHNGFVSVINYFIIAVSFIGGSVLLAGILLLFFCGGDSRIKFFFPDMDKSCPGMEDRP